jgi:hypothetical protein
VELEEIETALAGHPAVRESVVAVGPDAAGEQSLVGYFVSNCEPAPTVAELRRYLEAKLPYYMVPAVFVRMETLPLSPNGKVDRRALPRPEIARPDESVEFVAPRDETERRLTAIWEEALGVRPIGVLDDLFELGANSLIAAAVMARAQQALHKDVAVCEVRQRPTIAALATLFRGKEPQDESWTRRIANRLARPPWKRNDSQPSGGHAD